MYPARFLLIACALFGATAAANAEWHYDKQAIMGTEVHLQFWYEDSAKAEQISGAVMDEFRRIDSALSPYKENSELSQVNRQAGQGPIKISPEMAQIVDKSLFYSEITDGAFDITFATVGNLYDFREKKQADQKTTDSLRDAINYKLLRRNLKAGSLDVMDSRTRIDLGGIAKGYAVDRAVNILKQYGVTNANVSAGGDARLIGDKRGKPWLVGIRHPRDKTKNAAVIPLEDTAISTSGDYERFFIDDDDHRVHHIFNPATGKPADRDAGPGEKTGSEEKLISVSVIGPEGFDTDPLSTSVFVLGKTKGLALIDQMDGYEAIVIDANRKMFFSRGLANP